MGPVPPNISDQESVTENARRGRPPVAPARILAAADRLFADARSPRAVTMDAIAAAAGVGKGTLFRAFATRDGLLDALWAEKLDGLRAAVETGAAPHGPGVAPDQRAVAFLDALLTFKLENRHLIRAREMAPHLLRSAHYRWMHAQLQAFVASAAPDAPVERGAYAAHALLAAAHIDLVEELLDTGLAVRTIRHAQAAHARAVIDAVRRGAL